MLRRSKAGYFMLEGLNAFATAFYFYYLFFFMQRQFGFGNLGNLSLAALNGLVYTVMAWQAGRFGQRVGYFKALRLGFMILSRLWPQAAWPIIICWSKSAPWSPGRWAFALP